jgi:hypothetical protein
MLSPSLTAKSEVRKTPSPSSAYVMPVFDSKVPSGSTRKPHVSQARLAFQSTTAKWASSSGSGTAAFGIGTPSSKPGPWPNVSRSERQISRSSALSACFATLYRGVLASTS